MLWVISCMSGLSDVDSHMKLQGGPERGTVARGTCVEKNTLTSGVKGQTRLTWRLVFLRRKLKVWMWCVMFKTLTGGWVAAPPPAGRTRSPADSTSGASTPPTALLVLRLPFLFLSFSPSLPLSLSPFQRNKPPIFTVAAAHPLVHTPPHKRASCADLKVKATSCLCRWLFEMRKIR